MNTKAKGDFGEETACLFLQQKGFAITHRQYKSRWGEIDIIAQSNTFLLFVEVKLRSEQSPYTPGEAVTVSKQEKIKKTAMVFLSEHQTPLQPRFDVIELYCRGGEITDVRHYENAF